MCEHSHASELSVRRRQRGERREHSGERAKGTRRGRTLDTSCSEAERKLAYAALLKATIQAVKRVPEHKRCRWLAQQYANAAAPRNSLALAACTRNSSLRNPLVVRWCAHLVGCGTTQDCPSSAVRMGEKLGFERMATEDCMSKCQSISPFVWNICHCLYIETGSDEVICQ